MQQNVYYNPADELDEELNINFKKIFMIFWSRREIVKKVFLVVLAFFILLTFIMPKKYKVTADLYINKSNSTNLMELNPYAIEELGGLSSLINGINATLANDLEIIKSPLVMDKVVKDNNIVYKKRWGIIPNKREGEYVPGYLFAKSKNLSIENKKGTSVVSIEFKSKNPELAYNVVCSIITNYIDIAKQMHSEKAKKDTKVLESEYKKVKENLNARVKDVSGLPQTAIAGTGNIAALSAFSKSAELAISSLQNQYASGTKSQIALQEETEKMTQIAKKLQWAKMVEEMSDSSKVLILREPTLLRKFENSSPKLLVNIILGIIFGSIAAFWAVVYIEIADKKVSYSKLGDNIIYNDEKKLFNIQKFLINYKDQNIACVVFDSPEQNIINLLSEYKSLNIVKATISTSFIDAISQCSAVVLLSSIGKTDADIYQSIKETLKIHNKQILEEILI